MSLDNAVTFLASVYLDYMEWMITSSYFGISLNQALLISALFSDCTTIACAGHELRLIWANMFPLFELFMSRTLHSTNRMIFNVSIYNAVLDWEYNSLPTRILAATLWIISFWNPEDEDSSGNGSYSSWLVRPFV